MLRLRWQTTGSVILAGGVLWGAYAAVSAGARWFGALESDVARAILAAAATVAVSFITVIAAKQYEQRATLERENRQRRIPVYEQFVHVIQSLMREGSPGFKKLSEQEKTKQITDVIYKMMVWASDDVIKAFGRFRYEANIADATKPAFSMMDAYEDLILALRRDLGHRGSAVGRGDILRLFINDYPSVPRKAT